jgi:hypothetical protein
MSSLSSICRIESTQHDTVDRYRDNLMGRLGDVERFLSEFETGLCVDILEVLTRRGASRNS